VIRALEDQRRPAAGGAEDAAACWPAPSCLHEDCCSAGSSNRSKSAELQEAAPPGAGAFSIRSAKNKKKKKEEVRRLITACARARAPMARAQAGRPGGFKRLEQQAPAQPQRREAQQGWRRCLGDASRLALARQAREVLASAPGGAELTVRCGVLR